MAQAALQLNAGTMRAQDPLFTKQFIRVVSKVGETVREQNKQVTGRYFGVACRVFHTAEHP